MTTNNTNSPYPYSGKGFWFIGNPENKSEWIVVKDGDYSEDKTYYDYMNANPNRHVLRLDEEGRLIYSRNGNDSYDPPQ